MSLTFLHLFYTNNNLEWNYSWERREWFKVRADAGQQIRQNWPSPFGYKAAVFYYWAEQREGIELLNVPLFWYLHLIFSSFTPPASNLNTQTYCTCHAATNLSQLPHLFFLVLAVQCLLPTYIAWLIFFIRISDRFGCF